MNKKITLLICNILVAGALILYTLALQSGVIQAAKGVPAPSFKIAQPGGAVRAADSPGGLKRTRTPTPTLNLTLTSPTATFTASSTRTRTATPTATFTASPTRTRTATPSPTPWPPTTTPTLEPTATWTTVPVSSNVVQNPSFEIAGVGGATDAASWTEGTNHTRANDQFNTGSWSLKSAFMSAGGTTTRQTVSVVTNMNYTYSAYFWEAATNAGSGTCADMSDIGGEVQLCATLIGAWQFKSGVWQSGTTTSVTLRLITDGSPNAGSWFDDISLAPQATPTPSATPTETLTLCPSCPTPTTTPDTIIVAGAGDIACGLGSSGGACKQMVTSDLLLSLNPDKVINLGDDQYEDGSLSNFQNYYDPSWGRVKAKTSPAVGNHEYLTSGAAGYFDYFNGVGSPSGPAGDRTKGYYSYNLGNWHFVVLNSNCSQVGCSVGGAQYTWLQNDLAADNHPCSLAYQHHPLASSDDHNFDANTPFQPLLKLFYDDGGELVLVGHSHFYERFARMDANKNPDPTYGFRHIVVGTGGRNVYGFGSIRPLSEVRDGVSFGVIKLTLRAADYTWDFVPAAGYSFTDTGTEACHGVHP